MKKNLSISANVCILFLLLFLFSGVLFNANASKPGMLDVIFKYKPKMDDVKKVNLAGTFNNWSTTRHLMQDNDGDGVWEITIELKPGKYQYKFVINGDKWRKDPHSNDYAPDGFGGQNSVITVGDIEQNKKKSETGDGKIIKDLLWHDQERRKFANRITSKSIILKFQTKRNDVSRVVVNYRDRDGYHSKSMKHFTYNKNSDFWKTKIYIKGDNLKYRFIIMDGDKKLWYGKKGVSKSFAAWYNFSLDSQNLYQTPKWVRNAIFYQIFPDRFYNGNYKNDPDLIETYKNEKKRYENIVPAWNEGIKSSSEHFIKSSLFTENDNSIHPKAGWHVFYGGDLQGVKEKLPYLKDLGINAIYFNPIFEAPGNHRYNTTAYEYIDDNLAIKNDYEASQEYFYNFIKEAHSQGIRIVLDAVFNHTGYEHYAFQDVIKKGRESKYWDWYYIKDYPIVSLYEQRTEGKDPNYRCWAGFGSLPKLNVNNPEVQDYLYRITKKWMDPDRDGDPADGIDGWRLDVANEVKDTDPDFWKDWRQLVKSINPEAYITGEIWGNASNYLQGEEFDGVMNYRFRETVLNFIARGRGTGEDFINDINLTNIDYPRQSVYSLQNLIGSHDTARFLTLANNNKNKLKLAAMLQFVYPGAPMIYYGDEIGMKGESDPDCRRTMIWKERPGGIKPDKELFEYYQQLIKLRSQESALRKGDLSFVNPEETKKVVGIKREFRDQLILTVINAGNEDKIVSLPLKETYSQKNILLGDKVKIFNNNKVKLELEALSGVIVKLTNK